MKLIFKNFEKMVKLRLTKNSKVFNQLLNFRREKFPTSRACQYVRSSKVHETNLTKSMTTM